MQDGARLRWIGPPASSRAFSLIELLVGIGIVLVLMGIAVASVVRAPRLNRMVAAEQLISDVIRQARHTARTSGQPVVVRLDKDNRSISGLVSHPLWHMAEGWPGEAVAGITGSGLKPDSVSADSDLYGLPDATLVGGQRLWSGSSSRRSDLRLSLCVRPQLAAERTNGDVEPLVVVDESGVVPQIVWDPDPNVSRWPLFGLGLILRAGTGASDWEVFGWFGRDQGLGRVEVSSLVDRVGPSLHSLPGGSWCEITMAVDGDALLLYRDGQLIARKTGVIGANVAAPYVRLDEQTLATPSESVVVGIAQINAQPARRAKAIIDNIRLDRLGDAMSGTLPAGTIVDSNLRLTCHPSGQVESVPSKLKISGQGDGAMTILDIDGMGNVTRWVPP